MNNIFDDPLYSHANISPCQAQSATCTYCLPLLRPIRTHFGHRIEYKMNLMKWNMCFRSSLILWLSQLEFFLRGVRNSCSTIPVYSPLRHGKEIILMSVSSIPSLLPHSLHLSQLYLQATSFGVSRSIVWLQSRRDAAIERNRGGSTNAALASARRDDQYEFRLGRIKHERVKVRDGRRKGED